MHFDTIVALYNPEAFRYRETLLLDTTVLVQDAQIKEVLLFRGTESEQGARDLEMFIVVQGSTILRSEFCFALTEFNFEKFENVSEAQILTSEKKSVRLKLRNQNCAFRIGYSGDAPFSVLFYSNTPF
jgi:hypothetical protein